MEPPADRVGFPGKVISFYIVPLNSARPVRADRGTFGSNSYDSVLENWDEYGGVGLSTEREIFPKPQIDQGSAVIGKAQGFHQVTLESLIADEGHLRGIGQFDRWLSEVDQTVDDHARTNGVLQ